MNATHFQVRGWHVLTALLAFFGAIIAVNIAFAVIAVRSFPGEDVRRSYVQGLQYNDTLAERRVQQALGWQASADLRHDGEEAVVEVIVRARGGAPVSDARVTGALQWPVHARRDHTLAFTSMGDGRYQARVGPLQPGRWRLRARAEAETGALDFEAELRWQASR